MTEQPSTPDRSASVPVPGGDQPSRLDSVRLDAASLERYRPLLDDEAWADFEGSLEEARTLLGGRRLWHLNSTARGGGVAELLARLVPLAAGRGLDARWIVLEAPPPFFELTKRIHNLLHAEEGATPQDLEPARELYECTLEGAGRELASLLEPGDVLVVHDPQPAGLVPAARRAGARVVWRCHVGTDQPGPAARAVWGFLLPYVGAAEAWVFSRRTFLWDGLDPERSFVAQPAIDPFSPKNQELDEASSRAIMRTIGLFASGVDGAAAEFRRTDGRRDVVGRAAEILQAGPVPAGAPIVAQVSRWDRLKDHPGVMEGFVRHVPRELGAHLVLTGPAVGGVDDDPEALEVLDQVRARWRRLDEEDRRRVHVVALPMDDLDENSAMVNAIQRSAAVLVQKSLSEGFGLTVVEAMWKGRPVLASRRGGIQDQVEHGRSGLLLDDPRDLRTFGAELTGLLRDPRRAEQLGANARQRANAFLAPVLLAREAEIVGWLLREAEDQPAAAD